MVTLFPGNENKKNGGMDCQKPLPCGLGLRIKGIVTLLGFAMTF